MTDISQVNLRLIDTTVLLIFLGLMRHRKATDVAREMGLTQPAVSHALKRLRTLYEDPLFLRRAHGLEPTSLAQEGKIEFLSIVCTKFEVFLVKFSLNKVLKLGEEFLFVV